MKTLNFFTCGIALAMSAALHAEPLQQIQAILDDADGFDYMDFTRASVGSPDLKHVYTISKTGSAINALARSNTGELTLIASYVANEDTGEGARSPEDIVISPDGKHLYVTALKPDDVTPTLYVYQRDSDSGELTEIQTYRDRGIASPTRLAMSDDGLFIYAASHNGNSVTVFARNANGTINEQQYLGDLPQEGLTAPRSARTSTISPDQNHVYVALTSINDAVIQHYQRDTITGELTYSNQIEPDSEYGRFTGLTVSQDGNNLYAAGNEGIVEIDLDDTGAMTVNRATPLDNPDSSYDRIWWINNVVLSANDRLAYGTDLIKNALVVFVRDQSTGELTYGGAEVDGVDGVSRIRQNDDVVLSPDGLYAYVGSASGFASFALYADSQITHTVAQTDNSATVTTRLSNAGPATAHDISFTLTLPEGTTVTSATAFSNRTECQQEAAVVTCHRQSLTPLDEEEITITFEKTHSDPMSFSASVTQAQIDIDESSNSYSGNTGDSNTEPSDPPPENNQPEPTTPVESGEETMEETTEETADDDNSGSGSSGPLVVALIGLGLLRLRRNRLKHER